MKNSLRVTILALVMGLLVTLGVTVPAHAAYQEVTKVLVATNSQVSFRVYTDAWPGGYLMTPGSSRDFGWTRISSGGAGLLITTGGGSYRYREAVTAKGAYSTCKSGSTGYRPPADWGGVGLVGFIKANCTT